MPNCACSNIVNPPKRHVYIVLFKGDDSDFAWNQNIEVTLDTEMDLTGFRAKFSFVDFTQEFTDITSKKLVLVFPATATESFPLGASDASIVLYDPEGKARTIANRIHIIVTKCVEEAYANEDPQAITVSISSSMEREQSDWTETDTQSPSYIRNKPEIPAVDTTLTLSGAAADAKTVGDALRSGFTEWVCDSISEGYEFVKCEWKTVTEIGTGWFAELKTTPQPPELPDFIGVYISGEPDDAVQLVSSGSVSFSLSRHLITPTKTSQLTNDGAPGGGGTPYATTGQIPSASTATPQMDGTASPGGSAAYSRGDHVHPSDTGKFDGAAAYPAWSAGVYSVGTVRSYNGRLYKVASQVVNQSVPPDSAPWWEETTIADLKQDALSQSQLAAVNSGATSAKVTTWDGYAAQIAQKANATDLPYRLVEPGKWEYELPEGTELVSGLSFEVGSGDSYYWIMDIADEYGNQYRLSSQIWSDQSHVNDLSVTVSYDGGVYSVSATRPSLPGHLLDRAGNRVVVSGDTTLTLPAAVPGYCRDFLVRLEISGSTMPTITFAAPTGESITYETDGDEFPVPDEAGDWLYSFTESCVAHKFAVSLKKVNTVAQGGS